MVSLDAEPAGRPAGFGGALFDQHARLLAESAISPEVALERGYVSVDTKTRLEHAGFSSVQRRVPGLLIPVHGVSGEVVGHEYRPDTPRMTDAGRVLKYEKAAGSVNHLDVPPRVRDALRDPAVPLWITEGARKADSAVSAGLCCVGLAGVYGWRGTDAAGGKVALGDWEDVALNGREVVAAFDSDAMTKKPVYQALRRFATFLQTRGATVSYCILPPGDDGKCGLDDYLAAGHGVEELHGLVVAELPSVNGAHSFPPGARATAQPLPVEAPRLASEHRILDRFRAEVRLRGLVGEERNAATLYLVLTSRLLDRQVSAGVKGHSSSGKSYAVETILKFFPADAVIVFTAFSEKALIYSTQEFKHRTIVIYELTGLREGVEDDLTSYFVRTLLSEGRIDYEVTTRDKESGGFTTKKIVKEGPTNLLFTTTKTKVHPENETRVLSLHTDDSTEQTARVFLELANEMSDASDSLDEWRQLQAWLAQGEHRVTIPYARRLAELIPPVAVRLRRDFGALLALIRAHAVLHQATRNRDDEGRIVATVDDYTVVRELVADTIAEGVEATVSPTVRETVDAVTACRTDMTGVTALAVAHHLHIDKSNASRRLRRAADGGYLTNLEDRRGKPARWIGADALPTDVDLLPHPRNLDGQETPGQSSGCAVARTHGEKKQGLCIDCGAPLTEPADAERCEPCWHRLEAEVF